MTINFKIFLILGHYFENFNVRQTCRKILRQKTEASEILTHKSCVPWTRAFIYTNILLRNWVVCGAWRTFPFGSLLWMSMLYVCSDTESVIDVIRDMITNLSWLRVRGVAQFLLEMLGILNMTNANFVTVATDT